MGLAALFSREIVRTLRTLLERTLQSALFPG